MKNWLKDKHILITGGTSGLGKSLVLDFLNNGNDVISVARNEASGEIQSENYKHYVCDFSNLSNVKELVDTLTSENKYIDILINNAGLLSPPDYQETSDGFELSYQVNFLSHLVLTRLLIKSKILNPGLIVNISSPIHSQGHLDLEMTLNPDKYKLFKAYANTKLYMAMLSRLLSEEGINSFSFNPGTFNSGIYRMQKKWFRIMYKVAAPFMNSSQKVADSLFKLIRDEKWQNGIMMNKSGKQSQLLDVNKSLYNTFWDKVNSQASVFLN